MFIVTRIWISISDLDLNSIIESHNENLKNLLNFIIIIKMANGMGSFAFFGFISRPWHFWAKINYHCDPFDTRTPNFYFLGWFSDLFFWPKKRCAFWLKVGIFHSERFGRLAQLRRRRWFRSWCPFWTPTPLQPFTAKQPQEQPQKARLTRKRRCANQSGNLQPRAAYRWRQPIYEKTRPS